MKYTIRLALLIYFRRIKVEGRENIPKNQPLLVIPNHQNAFLDAFLVGSFLPMPIHFLTRADVFKKWTIPFLKLVNMMPVYRIRDGYAKLSMNDATFEACRNLFIQDKSVLIFAEGNHGEHHYLRPLTKGAARMAFSSQASMEKDLKILPVGLNYFDHHGARSTLLMSFGKTIAVRDFEPEGDANQAKALIQLRDAISSGMKETLAIPEETEDYEERKQTIFDESNSKLSLEELRNLETKKGNKKKKPRRRIIGPILNPVPFLVIKKVLSGVSDIVFHSSIKFAVGLFVFPIWWILVCLLIGFTVGFPIAFLTVFVMVSGLFYSYT